MNHGIGDRARRMPRPLAAFLVLLFLAAPLLRSAPPAAARSVEDGPLDLAALALTPADLEAEGLEGYGVADGDTRSPEAVAAGFAFQRGLPDDEARDLFAETGMVHAYTLRLDLPVRSGNDAAVSITSTIHEYVNEDGAAAGFALLSDWGDSETVEEVETDESIGDESILTRHRGTTPDPFHAVDLTFRVGRLTAFVRLVDLTGDAPAAADPERLAGRLRERIEADTEADAAGIAGMALQVAHDRAVPISDFYTVQDDQTVPWFGQTAEDVAADDEDLAEAGLTDEFMVRQEISAWSLPPGDIYFYSVVQEFADEEAASAYLRGEPARQAERDGFDDFEEIEDLAEYGDESVAYTQTYRWESRGVDLIYQTSYLRVGDRLAMIQLIWPEEPPLAALEELAAAQAACLDAGACAGPAPLPAALRPIVEGPGDGETDADSRMAAAALPEERTWVDPSGDIELTYDPASWEIAPEQVLAGDDILMLIEDGGQSVVGLAVDAGSGGADDCVEERFANLAPTEARGEARPLTDESGEPIGGGDTERAYGAYGVRLDDGTDQFLYLECRSFADGEAVLAITHVGPLDRYEARVEPREDLLDGLVFPGE